MGKLINNYGPNFHAIENAKEVEFQRQLERESK